MMLPVMAPVVFVQAEALVQLLLTNDMQYDVACGMDFERLKFYDVWVTRDISVRVVPLVPQTHEPQCSPSALWRLSQGEAFSSWYPFVQDPLSQLAMRYEHPFRVYSCWNGAVVLPGNALVDVRGRCAEP